MAIFEWPAIALRTLQHCLLYCSQLPTAGSAPAHLPHEEAEVGSGVRTPPSGSQPEPNSSCHLLPLETGLPAQHSPAAQSPVSFPPRTKGSSENGASFVGDAQSQGF